MSACQVRCLLQGALDRVLQRDAVRNSTITILEGMLGNAGRSRGGAEVAWAWWLRSWRRLLDDFGPG